MKRITVRMTIKQIKGIDKFRDECTSRSSIIRRALHDFIYNNIDYLEVK